MLIDMIENEIPKKLKIVIFSKFAYLVIPHIVESLRKFAPISVVTGKTKDSDLVLKKFKNSKIHRILVCSDAIKYGINLQCANYVINFDMPWNPAIVAQRIARCYRKGQEKPVTVINFMVPDTIEKYLFDMLDEKRSISNKMLGAKGEVNLGKLLEML
jgi:SNF2 family DNA or RNA helicase